MLGTDPEAVKGGSSGEVVLLHMGTFQLTLYKKVETASILKQLEKFTAPAGKEVSRENSWNHPNSPTFSLTLLTKIFYLTWQGCQL